MQAMCQYHMSISVNHVWSKTTKIYKVFTLKYICGFISILLLHVQIATVVPRVYVAKLPTSYSIGFMQDKRTWFSHEWLFAYQPQSFPYMYYAFDHCSKKSPIALNDVLNNMLMLNF